jgi:hypothetical protein
MLQLRFIVSFGLLLFSLTATAEEQAPELNPLLAAIQVVDAAMKKQGWAKAESDLLRIVEGLGHSYSYPRETILSELFFKKGWCELKQQKWRKAGRSFETCYKYFPTKPKQKPSAESLRFRRESLRYWAAAEFNLEEYKGAAILYRLYLKELNQAK